MLELQPPTFEAFEREARQGNVVPVVRSVLADLHTPVGAFMRIAGNSPFAFLLESVEGGERIARYSFLGTDPEMIVRGIGMQTFVERNGKTESYPGAATEWVRDYFRDRKLARRSGLVPFAGGAVGVPQDQRHRGRRRGRDRPLDVAADLVGKVDESGAGVSGVVLVDGAVEDRGALGLVPRAGGRRGRGPGDREGGQQGAGRDRGTRSSHHR